MSEDAVGLQSLAHYVRLRRTELDVTQMEIWEAGGPSNSTLTAIENGRPPVPSRSTLQKLDKVLGWVPGSARRTIATGEAPAILSGFVFRASSASPEHPPASLTREKPPKLVVTDLRDPARHTFAGMQSFLDLIVDRIEQLEDRVAELEGGSPRDLPEGYPNQSPEQLETWLESPTIAARRGPSAGRSLREDQDQDAENQDLA